MAMYDPPHPGEIIRDAVCAEGWTVAEAATRLGVTRNTLSRVLNGKARRVTANGVGPGANRLERRWALGADARRLRLGTSPRVGGLKIAQNPYCGITFGGFAPSPRKLRRASSGVLLGSNFGS